MTVAVDKRLAQRVADPIVAELTVDSQRVQLLGAMADVNADVVSGVEVAVLSAPFVDYFGEQIEPLVMQAVRRMLSGGLLRPLHATRMNGVQLHLFEGRRDLIVVVFVCETVEQFEGLVGS